MMSNKPPHLCCLSTFLIHMVQVYAGQGAANLMHQLLGDCLSAFTCRLPLRCDMLMCCYVVVIDVKIVAAAFASSSLSLYFKFIMTIIASFSAVGSSSHMWFRWLAYSIGMWRHFPRLAVSELCRFIQGSSALVVAVIDSIKLTMLSSVLDLNCQCFGETT